MDEPISSYALLSDCQGSALVSTSGSIDWACLPRFDSPSVFGRLLDADAGRWHVAPIEDFETECSYLEDTMAVRIVFRTGCGAVALTDALALGPDKRGHHIGRHAPHAILRVLEGLAGTVEMERDASLTVNALWVAACPDEVGSFLGFFAATAAGHVGGRTPPQILYGVTGNVRCPSTSSSGRLPRGMSPCRCSMAANVLTHCCPIRTHRPLPRRSSPKDTKRPAV